MIKSLEIVIFYMAVHMFVTPAVLEKSFAPDIMNLTH